MSPQLKILLLEDNPSDEALVIHALQADGLEFTWQRVETEGDFRAGLDGAPDVILADYHLPHFDAPRALAALRERGLPIPFIVVTGAIGEEEAVACMRQGATDYLLKDRLGRLGAAVRRALEEQRLRAAQAHADAQARSQAHLLDAAGQAIIATDAQGRITYWNRAATDLYGWTADEVLGRDIVEVTPAATTAAQAAEIMDALGRGASWSGEFMVQRRDGSTFPALVTDTPMYGENGVLIGVIGVSVDISARQQAEETLRRSEEQYRRIVETANEGILVIDGDERITYVNERLAQMLGYTVDEMLGMPALALTDEAGQDEMRTRLEHRRHQGMRTVREVRYRRKDGTSLWVIGSGSTFFDAAGRYIGALGMYIDITARKEAEQQAARHVTQLSTLRLIDMAITASVDLSLTLHVILQQVVSHLAVDAATVLVRSEQTQVLEHAAGLGFRSSSASRTRYRVGEGPPGQAALERRRVVLSAASGETLTPPELVTVEGFVTYIAQPLLAKGQVHGVLELFLRRSFSPDLDWLDFMEAVASQAAIAIDNAQLFAGLQRSTLELTVAYDATLEGWSRALDLRDKETEGHSRRVTDLTLTLARAMGMGDEQLVHARRGALLHDIGKMGIPDQILLKPGPLTTEEWSIMRRHPTYAYELLLPIHYLRPALDIPYRHHEKWDGTGYPHGLAGERIPLAARIFAVVDVFDALRSDRPYRPGWPLEQVRDHIREQAGSHFDPAVVETFLALQ